jgi:hypothetical protein
VRSELRNLGVARDWDGDLSINAAEDLVLALSDSEPPKGVQLLNQVTALSFGANGWLGMAGIRLSLAIMVYTSAVLAFPTRRKPVGVGHELDAMLAEGQGGFSDIMKRAPARKRGPAPRSVRL